MPADSPAPHAIASPPGALSRPGEPATAYALAALSEATRRAYRADWRHFSAWCRAAGHAPLGASPAAIADYLASLAPTHGRAALRRRLAAIGQAHRLAGHTGWTVPGLVRATLRGILRRHATPPRKAAALTSTEIRALAAAAGQGLTGSRDRALLLVGFAAALRRSEIVAIDREHLTRIPAGFHLLIPSSKTDPEHAGAELVIPVGRNRETCPVRALDRWIELSATDFGPLFRRIDRWGTIEAERLHPDSVRLILARLAARAGITVPAHERLSPHGLRAGFITETYRAGARDEAIMAHTRHRSHAAMRGYLRRAKLGQDNPAKLLDL